LATGSLKVTVEDVTTTFVAPTAIKVLAHKVHELEALEDNTLAYCVHALRDAVTEDVLPPEVAYTDQLEKPFIKTEGGIVTKPLGHAAVLNGERVEVAPMAFIPNDRLNKPETFNRNQDDVPLTVVDPYGAPAGKTFV
jgi:hypothetical protein